MFPLNIGYLLDLNANRYPEKTAIIYKDLLISYRELNQKVNRLSNSLLQLGIRKSDKVGYLFPNGNKIVELYFALQKIGAVAVPLNHRLVSREIKCLLDSADCKAFVYCDQYTELVNEVKQDFKSVQILIKTGEKITDEYSFEELLANNNQEDPGIVVEAGDLARIQFTGGTTGRSKGVMRTHENDIYQTIGVMGQNKICGYPGHVVLTQCPLHHTAGITWLLTAIANGAAFVICDVFDPVEILTQIQKYRVTYLLLLPVSTYLRLIDIPNIKEFDTSTVQLLQMSAGGTSSEIILRVYEAFPNCEINYGWGQTETGAGSGGVITREMALNNSEKLKSVGRPMPFFEMRIVDDQGRDVPVGEIGECIARGPAVMQGYYKQPELTAATIKDGWSRTGDMFKQDEDGYYYIMDRKKDMIKTGGENVFAQEVESIICNHPAIQDCAVIGVPDRIFQEAVMAVIKVRTGYSVTIEEIWEHCKKDLSSYKKPRYIEFVDSFPVDSAGKIQKYRLREIYKDIENRIIAGCKSCLGQQSRGEKVG